MAQPDASQIPCVRRVLPWLFWLSRRPAPVPHHSFSDAESIERRTCLENLAAARDGADRVALRRCESAVVERFRPYADRIARRFRGRGVEDDDLRQLARLGLCKSGSTVAPGP